MSGRNAPDGPPINTNLSSDLDAVDQELKDPLSVYLLLLRGQIGGEDALFSLTVASIVPNEDIAVPSQKEIKPVSVSRSDHPLVDQSIWIAHYNRRSVSIFLVVLRI